MGVLNEAEKTVNFKENQIAVNVAKFIKEKVGKGPSEVRVKITGNIVICCICGFMTKAEILITQSGCPGKIIESRGLYKKQCFDEIEGIFNGSLGRKISYFFDSYIPENDIACWTVFLD